MRNVLSVFITIIIFTFLGGFFVTSAQAATYTQMKDTITTSRPSASSPLSANQVTTDIEAQIYDNGSVFIASDSAILRPDTGETMNTVTVASMSASNTPTSGKRIVYFTAAPANTHHNGDALVTPITAMHTISFIAPNTIPSTGKIVITFPTLATGDANTPASPSASTFQLNGISDTQVKLFSNSSAITFTGAYTNPTAGTSPKITLSSLSGSIAAGNTVTIYLGCTSATSSSCSTQAPLIINPTKTAGLGTSDYWTMLVESQDNSSTTFDSGRTRLATIESVQVQATVDPTLTFTITGISNGTAINNGNTTGCTNTETTNTGIASSPNSVNLGVINSAAINIAAQLMTVSTNGQNGYTLTATSSGHLIDPAIGFWIPDSGTTPTVMTVATPEFGIHACGLDVNTSTWGTGTTGGGAGAKYGWPTQTSALTVASDSTGPIDNSVTAGNGLTSVEYAATINATVPAGLFRSTITYVATPTF